MDDGRSDGPRRPPVCVLTSTAAACASCCERVVFRLAYVTAAIIVVFVALFIDSW